MTIEIKLLAGEIVSGPMLLMIVILAMIVRDKQRVRRERGPAVQRMDRDDVA